MAQVDFEVRKYVAPVKHAAMVLSIVGAINWGLVALFNFDLVEALTSRGSGDLRVKGRHVPSWNLPRIVYGLVGLAGAVLAFAPPFKAFPYTRKAVFEKRPMTVGTGAADDYLH